MNNKESFRMQLKSLLYDNSKTLTVILIFAIIFSGIFAVNHECCNHECCHDKLCQLRLFAKFTFTLFSLFLSLILLFKYFLSNNKISRLIQQDLLQALRHVVKYAIFIAFFFSFLALISSTFQGGFFETIKKVVLFAFLPTFATVIVAYCILHYLSKNESASKLFQQMKKKLGFSPKLIKESFESSFWRNIDMNIATGQGVQITWLLFMALWLYLAMACSVDLLCEYNRGFHVPSKEGGNPWDNFGLIFMLFTDPSSFGKILDEGNKVPNIIFCTSLIVNIIGTLFFSGMVISVLSNYVQRRIDEFNTGKAVYEPKNHIVFIGFDKTLPSLVTQVCEQLVSKTGELEKLILIQSNVEIPYVKDEIEANLNVVDPDRTSMIMKQIIFYKGRRDNMTHLNKLNLHEAAEIYIIGDTSNPQHDELNRKCLDLVIRCINSNSSENNDRNAPIYLLVDNHTKYIKIQDQLIENKYENVRAFNYYVEWGKILIHGNMGEEDHIIQDLKAKNPSLKIETGDYQASIRTLNYKGFDNNGEKKRNLIIMGMTDFGCVIGIEAMKELGMVYGSNDVVNSIITFVCENAKEEMEKFVARYEKLFKEARYIYNSLDNQQEYFPGGAKKLPLTFEFIDSTPFSPKWYDFLTRRLNHDNFKCYLVACNENDTINMDSCLFLPEDIRNNENIDIYTLQQHGELFMNGLDVSIGKIMPFGMTDSISVNMLERIKDNIDYRLQNNFYDIAKSEFFKDNYVESERKIDFFIYWLGLFNPGSEMMKEQIKKADILCKQDRYDDALIIADNLVTKIKKNMKNTLRNAILNCKVNALVSFAKFNYKQEKYEDANNLLNKALQFSGNKEISFTEDEKYNRIGYINMLLGKVAMKRSQRPENYYKNSIEAYEKSVDLGNIEAMYELANQYISGNCVERDFQKALHYCHQLENSKKAEAFFLAGLIYHNNESLDKFFQKKDERLKFAYEIFHRGATLKDAASQNALGVYNDKGYGRTKDPVMAILWYCRAAKQGNAAAQFNLGECYYYGKGVAPDYAKAVEWYEKAARNGHRAAQTNLGEYYYRFENYDKAIEWFRIGAKYGRPAAQIYLGNCYYYGYGVPRDYNKAYEWYKKAADQGNRTAQKNVGDCYIHGHGVPRDYNKAYEWYQKATNQGYLYAIIAIADLYKEGKIGEDLTLDERKIKAFETYKWAAERGKELREEGPPYFMTLFVRWRIAIGKAMDANKIMQKHTNCTWKRQMQTFHEQSIT